MSLYESYMNGNGFEEFAKYARSRELELLGIVESAGIENDADTIMDLEKETMAGLLMMAYHYLSASQDLFTDATRDQLREYGK